MKARARKKKIYNQIVSSSRRRKKDQESVGSRVSGVDEGPSETGEGTTVDSYS